MKAELSVPSPSILRKRFGKVKARIKAAATAEEPKNEKKRISLSNPRILENAVRLLTKERFRENLLIYPNLNLTLLRVFLELGRLGKSSDL